MTQDAENISHSDVVALEGGEAVASVAYRTNEVIVIYPITPSSTMGEFSDDWSAMGHKNVWHAVPMVREMQSEAGAAGACHGALQAGSLSTTFTASQGLLLMIPNMYKIAGELTAFCMHVSARTIAAHGLSIFGDHSDVMACRQTGFALLASESVQEAHDFALIGQAATLRARIPFVHFFDGFRTSHEVNKISLLKDSDLRHMIDEDLVIAHRDRALTPDHPVLRGTAQNPDTFFQAMEARNPFYDACPGIVQATFDRFAERTGRRYNLFDYVGPADAERVIVIMGSGGETVSETVKYLNARGEKVGVVRVRLYRPFSIDAFVSVLPTTVKAIAVLDRTKECGAIGEPLFLDVVGALARAKATGLRPTAADPLIVGGRYGLSSKEFTPAMAKAVFDELTKDRPRHGFTVGINDDVTHRSLAYDPAFDIEPAEVNRAIFFGLGSDGTVGANKNSIKIIAESAGHHAQGYFVYDSKKSGAITISHLRFSNERIRAPYLISKAQFVACHHFPMLEHIDVLEHAAADGIFLVNAPFPTEQVWDRLPRQAQEHIIGKKLKVYAIDGHKVAREAGMGRRINTIMQVCFFAISGVLPRDEAIAEIKGAIEKTYAKKGRKIVEANFAAVDAALAHLVEIAVPAAPTAPEPKVLIPDTAPDFVKRVTAAMLQGKGDSLPVSVFSPDGTWPVGTTQFEKRNIALEIPDWDASLCIQCNKCALVCPHAAIRVKAYPAEAASCAPADFKTMDYKGKEFGDGQAYTVQVAPEDCTGCTLCVKVCPGKDKLDPERASLTMRPVEDIRDREKPNWDFFLSLPETDRGKLKWTAKDSQLAQPLIEFSGACSGCGETPYLKLLTQMYGDRALVANATGCSSIFGGNLPTTPYTVNAQGRGPAWSNSLFEDNAEFGYGFRLSVDMHRHRAEVLLKRLASHIGDDALIAELLAADQTTEEGVARQRERVERLHAILKDVAGHDARHLEQLADYLVDKVVWIVGGDGWAYDIGYGGLDHVLASGADVNILVMDTEVYSNTGGQQSKATTLGAAAKFAYTGKAQPKKDLGLMAMAYGHVYVAHIAFGAKDAQTVQAFKEAVDYKGPSLIIAYSNCIAHGYDMADSLEQQKLAVSSGYWPLYRYDPRRLDKGENPLKLESGPPKASLIDYMAGESRFQVVRRRDPARYEALVKQAETELARKKALFETLAGMTVEKPAEGG